MATIAPSEIMSSSSDEDDGQNAKDEEQGFLSKRFTRQESPKGDRFSYKFWIATTINTLSTVSIIFVNKHIFETESLRHAQVTFAAFHFIVTSVLLYILSRPVIGLFQAKRVSLIQIVPLALAMIFNVVLQNASLAYSTIQFYQIVRTLLTPCVAMLNYALHRITISTRIALTLVPICLGVAVVSYFDTLSNGVDEAKRTTMLGAAFAFSGVLASAVYTLWIVKYHKALECTSQQLLLNQAPVSVLLMMFIIPFSDNSTVWLEVTTPTWILICLSGVLACILNVSQFVVIDEGGALSSTIVGHFKSCCIILLGWIYSGKSLTDYSVFGVALAIGGIVSYCGVTHRETRK